MVGPFCLFCENGAGELSTETLVSPFAPKTGRAVSTTNAVASPKVVKKTLKRICCPFPGRRFIGAMI